MKNKHFPIIVLLLILWGTNTLKSQTFCLGFDVASNDGTTLELDIRVQGSAAFALGSSNFQFSFNPLALANPTFVSTNLTTAPIPVYQLPTVTEPAPGQASFNVVLQIPNFGDPMAAAPGFSIIGRVRFDILDAAQNASIFWTYTGGSTGTVVFLDDQSTQLFATSTSMACLEGTDGIIQVLPLELLAFDTKVVDEDIQLNWLSTQEEDFAGFALERSTEQGGFKEIAWIESQGNALEDQTAYQFLDKGVTPGKWQYYRLKMLDHDGSFEYSAVKAERIAAQGQFTIFPNPSSSNFTLSLIAKAPTDTQINISDLSGKIVFVEQQRLSKGYNEFLIQPGILPPGQYTVTLRSEQFYEQKKLMVIR